MFNTVGELFDYIKLVRPAKGVYVRIDGSSKLYRIKDMEWQPLAPGTKGYSDPPVVLVVEKSDVETL